MQVIQTLNGIFWGWLVAGILLGTGVFFTIRLKFPQIRYFTKLFGNLRESMKSEGGVSGFGALCAAVGGQVGTGRTRLLQFLLTIPLAMAVKKLLSALLKTIVRRKEEVKC